MTRVMLATLGLCLSLTAALAQEGERKKFVSPFAKPADVPTSGREVLSLRGFDELMTKFVAEHKLPGAELAIGRNGKVFYLRGFGYANVETQFPVQPESRFRIASISKPLTAVAILRLVAQNRLALDRRVVDVLADRFPFVLEPADPRLKTVTIEHLLHHSAGWDRDKSFDPMFRSPAICAELSVNAPAKPVDVMRYMWKRPLDNDPGTHYAYSNFGYCVLGRVIEAVSGQSYEDYVRLEVLAPLGIDRMIVGRTLPKDRQTDEVVYYDSGPDRPAVMGDKLGAPVPQTDGAWCLETMDAHGGWISTAEDLVKFSMAFTGHERNPIGSVNVIGKMFARPPGKLWFAENGQPKPYFYGMGWLVRPVGGSAEWFNAWHNGSLPGTSTLMIRRSDGVCWTVLFNSRETPEKQAPSQLIDPLLHEVAGRVAGWPR